MPKKLTKRPIEPEEFCSGLWVTVDPGVNTSFTVWQDGELQKLSSTISKKAGEANIHFIKRIGIYANSSFEGFEGCLIESTEFYQASMVSMISGTSGDLSLLAYITGAIIAGMGCEDVRLIKPVQWKGQLNYAQLENILRLRFNINVKNTHNSASIGIGLYAKGLL